MGRAGSDIDNDYHSSGGHSDDRDYGGHYVSSSNDSDSVKRQYGDFISDNYDYYPEGVGWPKWAVFASIVFVIAICFFLYGLLH